MKVELQRKLFDKYPELFKQKDLSIRESCMSWGCECGDGYFSLIDNMCQEIVNHLKNNPQCPSVEFSQVREKYGLLDVNHHGGDDKVFDIIRSYEFLSAKVCEECGSTDNVTQTEGWIVTRCDKCMDKYHEERGWTRPQIKE